MARADLDRPWARTRPARAVRELSICGVFDAIVRTYARTEVGGREHLERLDSPVVFAANHCSHVDTPVLLRSLPGRWRRRTAVTAAADYFYANRLLAASVSLAFGTVPLERNGGNGSDSIAALGRLVESGWSLVVFPEGTRSRDGRRGRLRPGAAILAARHGLPIVPIQIGGTQAAMPIGRRWMVRPEGGGRFARHTLTVSFGPPIAVEPGAEGPARAMEAVGRFFDGERG